MPIDREFLESVVSHVDCPTPGASGGRPRVVGKMIRFYYPDRDTLRWVPTGLLCQDCGFVEIPEGVTRPREGGNK